MGFRIRIPSANADPSRRGKISLKRRKIKSEEENLVQILPVSGSTLDPDPHSPKMVDPDTQIINAYPKQWFSAVGFKNVKILSLPWKKIATFNYLPSLGVWLS
jgi:hypothetical protein